MSDPVARLNAALEGRYAVERQLGEGGMATVYLAQDLKHNRPVALKVLKPEISAVVGSDRFLSEIETTANLQHPHILPLFDSGEAASFLFYVMPYVEEESLRDRIDREKQLPVDEAVRIATAVANALDYAHRHKVIHRDIKPANILLQDGEPVVADFGIALAVGAAGGNRLTETGLSLGTPFYMSPEQATGDQVVGPASDTYALACVLYEMLVGEPPYLGNTAQAVLGKIIQGAPVSATALRKSIPANVDAAVRKALETLPADRFTGAQDFARALRLDTGETTSLTFGAWPQYANTGHLVFTVDGTLMAALFDSKAMELRGPPIALIEEVTAFTISETGKLVYTTGTELVTRNYEAVWVSRDGEATPIDAEWTFDPGNNNRGLSLSPDGTRLAVTILDDTNYDIWIKELPRGPLTRLTFDDAWDVRPRWTPDGNAVTFLSSRGRELTNPALFSKRASFTGEAQLIMDHESPLFEGAYSPDGTWLIARTGGTTIIPGGRDVWSFRPDRDTVPAPLVVTDYDEKAISISPDGRWLMYESDETGGR